MDYGLGQFITGVVSVGLQVFQIWKETKDLNEVRNVTSNFDKIIDSYEVKSDGINIENLVPKPILVSLNNRVDRCWKYFKDVADNPTILPSEYEKYQEGFRKCICRELKAIIRLNGKLPSPIMDKWWKLYGCKLN